MGNKDHCHTGSNFLCFQCIRRETRTTVIPILIFTLFRVPNGKRWPLSYRFECSLCSVYPIGSEDYCHTDSIYHCIQCIRWETGTTVLLLLILTVFSVSAGNEDQCHAYSNYHCFRCIRWETRTTVIPIPILTVFSVIRWETRSAVVPILILTVFCVIDEKRGPLSYQF